jgi:hypothetical protein
MIKAHKVLLQRLGFKLGDGTNELTSGFLHDLFEVIKDHRTQCRQKGIDFPVLVAVVVPRLGIVEFKRADLDIASIRIQIVNFVREHGPKGITMEEIVTAFRMAYPDLRPGDVLEHHDTADKAIERATERRERIVQEATKIIEEEGDDDA